MTMRQSQTTDKHRIFTNEKLIHIGVQVQLAGVEYPSIGTRKAYEV